MSEQPDPVRRHAAEWLRCAEEDLTVARHTLSLGERCPHRLVAYHAQQCAEKAIKGLLVFHGIDFPRTHNIIGLLDLCAHVAPDLPAAYDPETDLTDYAVSARYPGEEWEVTRDEAQDAIAVAENVNGAVRAHLEAHGLPLEI
jgi:HEPN domain-containing protein